jgi:cytochrome c biogenesis protein CcdA
MHSATRIAALVAGLLTVLSPCVLPIVFGAANNQHRFGPAALAGGVTVSFVAVGLFVATAGFALSGLDHVLEATLVEASPAWLTQFTSSI